MCLKTLWIATLLATVLALPSPGRAYPLDAAERTGIARLDGYAARPQPSGALLPSEAVDLRLLDYPELNIPDYEDPELDREVEKLLIDVLGDEAERYAVAVLDLSDPEHPRYAAHRDTAMQNPGSVGKLVVALAVFQSLADIYPLDLAARERVLRETQVTADEFIVVDTHDVPLVNEAGTLHWRPLRQGDTANLWTFMDWMCSASSNAAASMVMKEAMLLRHYGRAYPPTPAERVRFWRETSRRDLGRLLAETLQEPIERNGLDLGEFRQGSFFTRTGKAKVPGTTSYASPRELVLYMLRMEQGRLVDAFSSREIKRLLYMTQRRIRYASSPALGPAAIYFKSGSLYSCQAEEGFTCGKYQGNRVNMLNSVITVESPAFPDGKSPQVFYITAVMSDVLYRNSAVAHQSLGTWIHRIVERLHPRTGMQPQ